MIYVCSAVSWVGFEAANTPYLGPGKSYTGVARRRRRRVARGHGHVHRDRRDERQDRCGRSTFPEPCYAGTRRLPATSSSSAGTRVSSRRTTRRAAHCSGASRRARARTTRSTIFQQNGKEYVAFLVRRQLARSDAARRQPLALRARRHARAGGCAGHGHRHRTRGREAAATTATTTKGNAAAGKTRLRGQLRRPATAPTGTAATAGPT